MRVEIPAKLGFLYEPHRYKILYGGRGGAKSWNVARTLLVMGYSRPLRIFCGREIQKSIADSVHKLLNDQTKALGLTDFYEILQTTIRGRNGTEFLFGGLKHNIANIKSLESVDIAWLEEAQTVTKASWDVLIPTIRKEGSEIWVTFNPELDTDETYKRFVTNPPASARVEKVNWSDNPWFPEVLRHEKDDLEAKDKDAFLTVWEGHCKQTLDGAVYANELRDATSAGRVTRVPHDPSKPVSVFFDLGWADCTSIWFVQKVGFEFRVVRAYQNRQRPLAHYLQHLQGLGYTYDKYWLPHDAQAKQLGTGMSVEEMAKAALGKDKVKIVPRTSIADGINALRTVFPTLYFDAELCADGLQALRRYRYDVDDSGQFDRKPLHDDASHFADSLRYMAVAFTDRPKPQIKTIEVGRGGPRVGQGWMS